jgi:hypothetical protein
VKHLSTGNNHQGFNLFGDSSRAGLPSTYKQPVHTPGAVTHFHKDDALNVVAGSGVQGVGASQYGRPAGQAYPQQTQAYTQQQYTQPSASGLPR